jgi:gamma-glutamyltranspeptidase/glutathione hydrolase
LADRCEQAKFRLEATGGETMPVKADIVPTSVVYRKPAVTSAGGVVAAQSRDAAAAGARILAAGGHAVDAAVATSLALGAAEPWMSGLGGGGFATIWDAGRREIRCLDFGMVAPAAMDPADYPLTGKPTAEGFFGWPGVVDDRNIMGAHSIAIPGLLAGLGLAHKTFGRLPWADLAQPAIALADRGLTLDWYGVVSIAKEAKLLAKFDETRRTYLPEGGVPTPSGEGAMAFLRLGRLRETLRQLAGDGPDGFYAGAIGRALIQDLGAMGCRLSQADLTQYQARFIDPVEIAYRDARIFAPSGLTAGPTLARVLEGWSKDPAPAVGAPTAEHYRAYATGLDHAYRDRLATMGEQNKEPRESCTSHFNVVDKDGNIVAWTQTLLSRFGSFVMSPSTGILMNNGIMWFDPVPGKPNSIRGGAKPLSNMCPTVALSDRLGAVGIGASGGRKIMPAVAQILSFLVDFGMDLDSAFHTPRIDVSGPGAALVDRRLGDGTLRGIAATLSASFADLAPLPAQFANPSAVQAAPDRKNRGAADLASAWSGAVAETELPV